MTVEENIYAALQGLVGGRVLADGGEVPTALPFIIYQQIGGEAPTFLERALPSKKNGRFQITVYANTRKECAALSLQIEDAMVAATAFQALPLSAPLAVRDDDTNLRGAIQDFTVWSDR